MTLVVGLTGGIASGKSTVSRGLVSLGARLVDADALARDVVAPGSAGLDAVIAHFGEAMRLPDGGLDRKRLGALVFADPERLRELEGLLHPRIRAEIDARIAAARAAEVPVVVLDAALLVEMGLTARCDLVVVVHCGADRQRDRMMRRDGLDRAAADARLAAQASDEQRLAHADVAIDNRGTLAELEQQIDALWRSLQARSSG